jgi:tetratricopeptide (TPR) repeat protein
LTISREVNNLPAITRALLNLGNISQIEGDYFSALQQYEEGLAICRQTQDSHLMALVLGSLGDLMLLQKNNLRAREYCEEALALCLKVKNKRTIAGKLLSFVNLLIVETQYARSAQVQGFAATMLDDPTIILTKADVVEIEKAAYILKRLIGEDSYHKEFDTGKTLQLEHVVQIVLKHQT